ncbi:TPA: hypothetical protein ACPZXW_005285 [Klebsiella pneumoniae]|jgi:hypothetical protein|uniref:hypothetical protein n=1 Tax=Klebsiella TaxID=570 RepID=UPI0006661E44|nr:MULTISPECIES: hypothetical protein [Klebsiella]MBA7935685.1 hypothetical protein [Klebsiella sp. RHBSTW-00215]NCB60471.1 hypothetical protein [Gammaproteobacteria bacterium]
MADRNLVERYVRKFRKELESYLVNGVSVRLDILYAKDGGGLVKVTFNQKGENTDNYNGSFDTLGDAVAASGQKAFGGNLKNIKFGGTNKIMDMENIYLIKSEKSEEWARGKATQDVMDIVSGSRK